MKKMTLLISAILISGISYGSQILRNDSSKIDNEKKIMMFELENNKKAEVGNKGITKENAFSKKLEQTENAFVVNMRADYLNDDTNDKYDRELIGFGGRPDEIEVLAVENKKLRSYFARIEAMERKNKMTK